MNGRQPGAGLDALLVGLRIKERDVVGQRTAEQLIVLHHRADQVAILRNAQPRNIDAANQHFAFGRGQQSHNYLQQRRLPTTRRPDDGDGLAFFNPQIDMAQDERL